MNFECVYNMHDCNLEGMDCESCNRWLECKYCTHKDECEEKEEE